MNYKTLKQKIEKYELLLTKYEQQIINEATSCTIQHVVNNSLMPLKGALELLSFDESNTFLNDLLEEVPTIIKKLDNYFQLLEKNPELLDKELGPGYYPEERKQLTDQEYIQYLITNYPK